MSTVPESQLTPILKSLIEATDKTARNRKTAVVWFNRLYYDVRRWNESFIGFLKTFPGLKEVTVSNEEYDKFLEALREYEQSLDARHGFVKGDLCTNLRVLSQRFSKDFEWLREEDPYTYSKIENIIKDSYATESGIISIAQRFIWGLRARGFERTANWFIENKDTVVREIKEYIDTSNQEVRKLHEMSEEVGVTLLSVSEYEEAVRQKVSSNPNIMVIGEVNASRDQSIHVGGNVDGSLLSTGEIRDSTIRIGSFSDVHTISIENAYLTKMPQEYAQSLKEFAKEINQQLEMEVVPQKQIAEIQSSANEIAKEMADIKPEESVSFEKRTSISTKLIGLAKALVKASPKIAEKVVSGTPLAPFSKLVGEGFEKIVARLLKEKPAQ